MDDLTVAVHLLSQNLNFVLRPDEVLCETVTYLILWQNGKGFDDGSKGHLALLGQISSTGKRVGGAADESGAGITWIQQNEA